MFGFRNSHIVKLVFAFALLLSTFGVAAGPAFALTAQDTPGAVYTLTNATAGNAVAVFDRSADGKLEAAGTYATGGLGTGAGLGSQGALVLSNNSQWLFAVNAGSDDISVFAVGPKGLSLTNKVASGGVRPISLTTHENMLYVLNAGGSGNITGFWVSDSGQLSAIAGSTHALSGNNVGPAQVQFSPNGSVLVVTEKTTNKIDTYTVGADGVASGPNVYNSSGATPFGFAFNNHNQFFVSEAPGSALSSYNVSASGEVNVITASLSNTQRAACWVAVTKNGKYAYTANAASGNVSGYRIAADGSVSLLNTDGITGVIGNGTSPIDMAVSNNSHYLYTLGSASHTITTFEIHSDGSLTNLGTTTGLVAGDMGLAAR